MAADEMVNLFLAKMTLVAAGSTHAAILHFGTRFPDASRTRQRLAGALSLVLWPSVLVCGRFLAFV